MREADNSIECQGAVAAAISAAEEVFPQVQKPRLLVDASNPDVTVATLRDILSQSEGLYDRGVPARVAFDQTQRGFTVQPLTPYGLVRVAHELCRPYALKEKDGQLKEINVRLPQYIAMMYLDWQGDWHLPPLNGIASAPLLHDDGSINSSEGLIQTPECGARTCPISLD